MRGSHVLREHRLLHDLLRPGRTVEQQHRLPLRGFLLEALDAVLGGDGDGPIGMFRKHYAQFYADAAEA